jgi:hypothetical protein
MVSAAALTGLRVLALMQIFCEVKCVRPLR